MKINNIILVLHTRTILSSSFVIYLFFICHSGSFPILLSLYYTETVCSNIPCVPSQEKYNLKVGIGMSIQTTFLIILHNILTQYKLCLQWPRTVVKFSENMLAVLIIIPCKVSWMKQANMLYLPHFFSAN